jgi:hypothetical protein
LKKTSSTPSICNGTDTQENNRKKATKRSPQTSISRSTTTRHNCNRNYPESVHQHLWTFTKSKRDYQKEDKHLAHSFLHTSTSFIQSKHSSHISTMKKRRERKRKLPKEEEKNTTITARLIMSDEEFKSITLDTAVLRITDRILKIHIGSIIYLRTESIKPLVDRIIETLTSTGAVQPELESYYRYNITVHLENYQIHQLLQVFEFETPDDE